MFNIIKKIKSCIKNTFGRRFKFTYCKTIDGFQDAIDVSVEYNGVPIGNLDIYIDEFSVCCEDGFIENILLAHFGVENLEEVKLFEKIYNKYNYDSGEEIKW